MFGSITFGALITSLRYRLDVMKIALLMVIATVLCSERVLVAQEVSEKGPLSFHLRTYKEVMRKCRAMVEDPDEATRKQVAVVLGTVPSLESARMLESLSKDISPDVRAAALDSLGIIGGSDLDACMRIIDRSLKDSNKAVVEAAIVAIGRLRLIEFAPCIATLIQDHTDLTIVPPFSIQAAMFTLGKLKVPGTSYVLARWTEHENPGVRHLAVLAIARISDRTELTKETLVQCLNDPVAEVVMDAIEGLARLESKQPSQIAEENQIDNAGVIEMVRDFGRIIYPNCKE